MTNGFSKDYIDARDALLRVSDAMESGLIASLAVSKDSALRSMAINDQHRETIASLLASQCVEAERKAAEPDPQPTTREEILRFVVQTDGVEQLQELASAVGEIGPSEHEQAMDLLELMLDHGACPDSGDTLARFVLHHYEQCRATVAAANAAA